MEMSSLRTVAVNGRQIDYLLERKQVKNLNLRIRKDGSVFVSANELVSILEIDEFVCSKASYIFNAIDKFNELAQYKPQPKQYVSGESFYIQGRGLRLQVSEAAKDKVHSDGVYIYLEVKNPDDFEKKQRMMNRFLNQECRRIFIEVLEMLHPMFERYGVEKPALKIREMDTRWGSCLAKKGIITLNKCLLEAPRNCIEYVVMHELCHFVHPNHSKHFYSFLTMLMPDWKNRKDVLEKTAVYWL